MKLAFEVKGMCPYWVVADPANIPEIVLVDEKYVFEHRELYVEKLKEHCRQADVLLLHAFDRHVEIVWDEPPDPLLKDAELPRVLADSFVRFPSGHLICSSVDKLPVAGMHDDSKLALIEPGTYRVEVFGFTLDRIEEQIKARTSPADSSHFVRVERLIPTGCAITASVVLLTAILAWVSVVVFADRILPALTAAVSVGVLTFYWLIVFGVRRSSRFRRIKSARDALLRSLSVTVISLAKDDFTEPPPKGARAPFVDLVLEETLELA